ncbi:MAG: recombinase family protein [Bacilli bacterium]|nr:recombinase family protein [Bacilli bacterium]MBP3634902.1 recombinase family protein [Bacilli bacterium]
MDLYTVRKQLNMGMPLTSIKLRVTDYARVSTDHLEQKKSLQNQVEHFEQYIKGNPNWTYISGYVDDGITGTSDIKRDNFMKMIEDARSGKFDLIVTKEISRFSRNTLDSIKYTRELLSFGVAVLFVNDNINTALPDSELRLTIMASMAQDEIRRLSERVKFGMNRAIERGEILGNDMLYGYKKDKDTGVLNIIDDEAKVVRRIYELYVVEELSLSKIAKSLNSEGLKTCQGKKWCISTISRMIENPKYKGYYCAKKSEIVDYMNKKIKYFEKDDWVIYEDKSRIPPIVDEELWERANTRLITRKKAFSERKKDKSIYKNRYLYSAKIYCGEHGTVFHRREFRKNKKDITWVCSEYLKKGKTTCDSPNIRESELDAIFKDLISKLQIDSGSIIDILMNYYKHLEIDTGIDEEIKSLEKEINNIYARKDKILELSIQGGLSNEEFYERNNSFNDKINELTKELNQLKQDKKKIKGNTDKTKELENILNSKVNLKSTITKIISSLLDHIVVSKISNDKNNMELNIFLSYKENDENKKLQQILRSSYEFFRGYDTQGTKRYKVAYLVNCYFCL